MLALILAISATLVHGALAFTSRQGSRSLAVPIFTIGVAACCAAGARFGASAPGGASEGVVDGVSAAELIVAPLVLVMQCGCFRSLMVYSFEGVRIWALAGLLVVLGGLGLVDRVDALNAQLLLVLSLGVMWVIGSREHEARERDPESLPDWAGALAVLAGVGAAGLTGWAIAGGLDARIALGLVSANLLVWGLGVADPARLATGLLVAAGVGVGGANITRIVAGSMAQPEWASGDRAQAIALELSSRPYLPGFGSTLPDTMLLVLGVLLVVLAAESPERSANRRWLSAGIVLGLAGSQAVWMWVGAG